MARFITLLLLVILCLNTAKATDDYLRLLKSKSATRYCGPILSEVLSVVCGGRYNTPKPIHDIQRREVRDNTQKGLDFPFASQKNLENFIKKFKRRRHRRGVYNECCENPCSYDILMGQRDFTYTLAVYLLAMFSFCVPFSSEDKLLILQSRNATYCGSALADALSIACKGTYNTPPMQDRYKRSALIAVTNYKAKTYLVIHKRRKRYYINSDSRGVYNECCKKPCSFSVLKSYCGD